MGIKGIKLATLKLKGHKYLYRGKLWILDKPVKSTSKNKKMMVLATKMVNGTKRVRLIHFGSKKTKSYSKKAKESYLKRSEGIRNKLGRLTKHDSWSANHWTRKIFCHKDKDQYEKAA